MNARRRRAGTARAVRRSKAKRAWLREYRRDAGRVFELAQKGFPLRTIAKTVRLDERLVSLILSTAEPAQGAPPGGEGRR
jgi:hypothetical protein